MTKQEQALSDFLGELHTSYESWYLRATRRSYRWYVALQGIVLLASFAAAVIAAVVDKDHFTNEARVALILLPLLGALATNILTHTKLYDQWRLREQGRLEFQELISEGRLRLAAATTPSEFSAIHKELHERAQKAEKDQAAGFFSFYSSAASAQFKVTPSP